LRRRTENGNLYQQICNAPEGITVPTATYTQGTSGIYSIEAGEATLIVAGTI
jgi:hypothetical protein